MNRLLTTILLLLTLSTANARHYDLTARRISTTDGLPTNIVSAIWQDSTGYIWIQTTSGLCRYDGYRVVQIDDSVRRVSTRTEELRTRDAEWVRMGNGKMERRGRNGHRQSWQLIPEEVMAYTHNDHFCVADVDGQTEAISTYGSGLYLYDKPSGELTCISDGLISSPYLTMLYVDRTGCLWLAVDYLGVICIRLNQLSCRQQLLAENTPISDRNNVRSVALLGDRQLLVGNQLGELYEYDMRSHSVNYVGLARNRVYAALKDRSGRLWTGTRGAGLWVDGRLVEGLPSPHIYKIEEDSAGNIWVAMLRGGVAKIGNGGKETFLEAKDCHDIVQDKQGRWWVAAEDSLYVMDSSDRPPRPWGVQSGYFVCLCKDRAGDIWAGSIGGGLQKFCDTDGELKTECFTAAHGLPNNNVYSIVEDGGGNIWLGTEDGLSFLDSKTGDLRSHRFSASMLSNVFNERAAVCLPDGNLLFGTHDGIMIIDSKTEVANNILPQTSITALMVNGDGVSPEQVDFSYKEHNLTFFFSNFQYSTLSSVLYQYHLEGFDDEWCEPTNDHTAVYRNLSPGRYVFHVRSNNGMGKWGEETTFEFTIRQPWWNTWWAWLLYILLIATVSIVVWRISRRILGLHRQIDVERRLSAFKKDFYDRIERELRNPVNVLQGAAENVQISGTSKTTVQSLRRGSKRMLRLMDMVRQFHRLSDVEIQVKFETDAMNEETEQRFRQIVSGIHAEETEYHEMAPPPINSQTVLVIEEDEDNLTHLTDTLNQYFRIAGSRYMEECESMVATHHPSLIIIDISGREKEGLELTRHLHGVSPALPVIHLSAYSDDAHHLRSLCSGATDYIVKPFSGKVLLERVRKALEQSILTAQEKVTAEKKEVLTDVGDKRFLDRMNVMLTTHVGDENFSVEQWASLMNLGRTQFYKRVKDLTGETPVQHLHRARLDYAARLLCETDATIEEVMLRAGYHNPTHFYQSFKKKFGMSPRVYRSREGIIPVSLR